MRRRTLNNHLPPFGAKSGIRGLALPLLVATIPHYANAAHTADHLVISEVMYDATSTETPGQGSGEFLEIFNPTTQDIPLNLGAIPGQATSFGSYFVSDSHDSYYKVVNGTVLFTASTLDNVLQFPAGAVIPAHSSAIVCSGSDQFLADNFPGATDHATRLQLFLNQPGNPQLFETVEDGITDGVPTMLHRSVVGTNSAYPMNLTNGGETLALFYWDGSSDLVQDVDIVIWKLTSSTSLINKDNIIIDGPDTDTETSTYLLDAEQLMSVGITETSNSGRSFQRRAIEEYLEGDSAGNGLTGHDETSEHWGSDAASIWQYQTTNPGIPLVNIGDSSNATSIADALSFFAPVAISRANGPYDEIDTDYTYATYESYGSYSSYAGYDYSTYSNYGSYTYSSYDSYGSYGDYGSYDVYGGYSSYDSYLGYNIYTSLLTSEQDIPTERAFNSEDPDAIPWVNADESATAASTTQDYGEDGTLTELYMASLDTDNNRSIDSLYIAIRGDLFGEPDGDINASFVLLDFDPGTTTGVTTIQSAGNQLNDVSGTLDAELTKAGFAVDTTTLAGIGFDGAVGITKAYPTSTDSVGWRTFGTGGSGGTTSNFAYVGSYQDVDYSDTISEIYGGALGTSHAGKDGFEAQMTYSSLAGKVPAYVYAVAVTTAGDGSNASPNTLPENSGDDLAVFPQTLDNGVCFHVASSRRVKYYVDSDGDGYGSSEATAYCGPAKSGYSLLNTDCDDSNTNVNPAASEVCDYIDNDCNGDTDEGVSETYYFDNDGDGYGDSTNYLNDCVAPEDYVEVSGDCNDVDATINPLATEICDSIDNDCDGTVDDPDEIQYYTQYVDMDSDGYGTGTAITDCVPYDGYSTANGDCNDANSTVYPSAPEVCDGLDNDCDSSIPSDEQDNDFDGYRVCANDCNDNDAYVYPGAFEYCDGIDNDCSGSIDSDELDQDGDGMSVCAGDCNDADASVYYEASEICDSKDNDCDGSIDEGVTNTYYVDSDRDNYGGSVTIQACSTGSGVTSVSGDCNDSDASVNPGATEVCDSKDNDCDGSVDEGVAQTFYLDADGDGAGGDTTVQACSIPAGAANNSNDCNDSDGDTYPGATELCDGVDNNCDSSVPSNEQDADNDGYRICDNDCKDNNSSVNPGATETCNGTDDDCDGGIPGNEFDSDLDGFTGCGGDCDDNDSSVNPLAEEVCDGINNDCNSSTDENGDADDDGYSLCDGDCDEDDGTIHPFATELCDDLDNDCDPSTDEDADIDGDDVSACDGDCDDSNADISPFGIESCNNIDDDCDGTVDEGFGVDVDGDGVGGPACGGTDCNDNDANIFPGQIEDCDDSIDNNCDGYVDGADEDCEIVPTGTPSGDDDASTGDDDASVGDDDASVGDDDASVGDDDASAGDDDASTGDDDASVGDDDASAGDDDASVGDDDASTGDDDASVGDDDASTGDDDASVGDDDASTGDDDASIGDDDASVGDDDASNGDDDASEAGDDDSPADVTNTPGGGGDDDSGDCSCNTSAPSVPFHAGTLLLGLLSLVVFTRKTRRL